LSKSDALDLTLLITIWFPVVLEIMTKLFGQIFFSTCLQNHTLHIFDIKISVVKQYVVQ